MTERVEHDLLGDLGVPSAALYGIHTVRALSNFAVSGRTIASLPDLVSALAAVKQAAALANAEIGALPQDVARAIVSACVEIRAGQWRDQFVVDVLQGGAGTSTNMNLNEVIANRALQLLGHNPGDYHVIHPLDHVNLAQSTNDVYPTAARIACHRLAARLDSAMEGLQRALEQKAAQFATAVKIGRTQLQEAVPITLGRELAAYATLVGDDRQRLGAARDMLAEVNLGGTAVGTELNAPAGYRDAALRHLAELTAVPVHAAPDLVAATADVGVFVHLSAVLRRTAVKLSKICNDLRLLSSGPVAGFADITLPAVQAGSSIMPGKVNPVIPELVNQIAFQVIGHDVTVTFAAEAGQLQLNAFAPIIVTSLSDCMTHLSAGIDLLTDRCVIGIGADPARLRARLDASAGLATALTPRLGYAAASRIARAAQNTSRSVAELAATTSGLTPEQIATTILAATAPTPPRPRHRDHEPANQTAHQHRPREPQQ